MREVLRKLPVQPHPNRGGLQGPGRLVVALLVASVGLTLTSLALPNVTDWPVLAAPDSAVRRLVDVAAEQSLPTWFSVSVLGLAAVVHLIAAAAARRSRLSVWRLWAVSAAVIAALSIDDATAVHEQLEALGRSAGAGTFPFAWVIPGAFAGIAVVVALGLLARRLRGASRWSLVAGLGLFLGAALGLETLNGAVLAVQGASRWYVVLTHVEELAEMVGAVLLLRAGLVALAVRTTPDGGWLVRYGSPRAIRPAVRDVLFDDATMWARPEEPSIRRRPVHLTRP
jgi:hypothetical protein